MTRPARIAHRAPRSLAKVGSNGREVAAASYRRRSRSTSIRDPSELLPPPGTRLGLRQSFKEYGSFAGGAVATKRTVLRPGPEPYVLRPPLAGRAGRFPAARTRRRTRPRPPRRGRQRKRCYCPFALRGRSPPGERFY